MKLLLTALAYMLSISLSAQWSNYYLVNNTNQDDLNILNIDYEELNEANIQLEIMRLNKLVYPNEEEKIKFLDVATTPTKVFDYGVTMSHDLSGAANELGFWDIYNYSRKIPHNSLFTDNPNDVSHVNVSSNNITTQLFISIPTCPKSMKRVDIKRYFKLPSKDVKTILSDVKQYANMSHLIENKYSEDLEAFIHRKYVSSTKIYGKEGFRYTVVFETESEITIKDSYLAVNIQGKNKVVYYATVTYTGPKDELTFEDLEGRRYYLQPACEKFIALANFEYRPWRF